METTVAELARLVGGTVVGDGSVVISGISGIKEAQAGDLTFLANPRYAPLLKATRASAVLVNADVEPCGKPMILCQNPSLAFNVLVNSIGPKPVSDQPGVHPTAIIGEGVQLGRDVSIQAYVVIQEGAEIGDESVIRPHCYIGSFTKIGRKCLFEPGVKIRERITIGNHVTIHSGSVIGSDGFGYNTVQGVNEKINQIGTVVLEDDVEVGANVTIDRARFDKTIIRRGTKIDNLVQIAHNVDIGEQSIVVAPVGVAGSAKIGKGVTLAGQSGVAGHVEVGDHVVVAARAGVTKNIGPNQFVAGFPAVPAEKFRKTEAYLRKLPKIAETLKALEDGFEVLRAQNDELRKEIEALKAGRSAPRDS